MKIEHGAELNGAGAEVGCGVDLLSFQQSASELIEAAEAARRESRASGGLERLRELEQKLAATLESGLSRLPTEPAMVQALRDELKKTRKLRNSLSGQERTSRG